MRAGTLAVAGALAATLIGPAVARADVTPLGLSCAAQGDGLRHCEGAPDPQAGTDARVKTFDGVPLDTNVVLPAGGSSQLPLVVLLHGWGGAKASFDDMDAWAKRGYAVLSYTARGFNGSCGRADNRLLDPQGCAQGWIHLADTRYEVRDTQELTGRLADEGIVDGQRVGVTGPSYAGGQSMALATLKDRVMLPNGSLTPWVSPERKLPMRIAAAAPDIPWTDLAYSLEPNGHALDYAITSPTDDFTPIGVMKRTYVSGLFAAGATTGYYAPPGVDPGADLTSWFARVNAGEPGDDPVAQNIVKQITTYHSSYYIDHSEAPAPLLISNGWTDDLFPADEALRYYNRTRAEYPSSPISLMFFDWGHARGSGKPADMALLRARQVQWFDRYLRGNASSPVLEGVETLTQTCPSDDDATSGGPYFAPDWKSIHPGEVRFESAAAQTLLSTGGDPSIGKAIDPVAGGGDACATTASDDQDGTATYRLPAATGDGYTLMGSPTVIADLAITGARADLTQVAARLWDIAPDGKQSLVGRALYRPTGDGRQVFQLHPNGWHFAAGHVAKLELLGNDEPYGRVSNDPFSIEVSNLDLRLPVHEAPAAGPVAAPAPPVAPSASGESGGGSGGDAGQPAAPAVLGQSATSPAQVPAPQPTKAKKAKRKAKRSSRSCARVKGKKAKARCKARAKKKQRSRARRR